MNTSATPPFGMNDDVIVIFGAGPGIGVASARTLAAAGARVACVDLDEKVALQSADSAATEPGKVTAHSANVTDRESVRAVLAEIATLHGKVTGVLNVVGRAHMDHAPDVTDAVWSSQLEINLSHHFIVAQESTTHLLATRGSYVAVASVNGLASSPNMLTYGVSKAGLLSLIRTFAVELGPQGVRYNAIAPGLVATPHAIEIGFTAGPLGETFLERIPLREFAAPEDIAAGAYYLLSNLGKHVTGQTLVIDGGSSANYYLPVVPVG